MSNPTELPDLERVTKEIQAAIADANSGADTYMAAHISAKRICAHPEGEAPQAVAQVYLDMDNWMDVAIGELPTWERKGYKTRTLYAAATLSPLCGAQHAESGKEAAIDEIRACGWAVAVHNDYRLHGEAHTFWLFTKDGRAVKGEGKTDAEALEQVRVEIGLAAQQAAAPGAKLMTYDEFFAEARRLGCKLPADVCAALAAAPDYSAPGTPEAPKPTFPISDDEMAALRRFWECATDGEGYDVEKAMMQRLAEMCLVQRKSGAYYMSTEFGLYVLGEYTMERAAQLDGGQEGSGS